MAPLPAAVTAPLEHFRDVVVRSIGLRHASSQLDNLKRSILVARASAIAHGTGVTPPESIPNTAVFVLFGFIGAGFVCTGIWFFFWAKNGGFHFKQTDWDDYKSTVLRRKGPNGTTLSGATESTDLGGGSIVGKKGRQRWKSYKDVDMESSIGTQSEMAEIMTPKSKKWKKSKKSKQHVDMRGGGDDTNTVIDDNPDDVVRAYRHEKPAKVGGLNRVADSSAFDGSTADGSTNSDAQSALLENREVTPTNSPAKPKKIKEDSKGVRQVQPSSNFWDSGSRRHKEDSEIERIRSEAKKLQEKGRAAARRDFSYTQSEDNASTNASTVDEERRARRERRKSRSPTKVQVPGSWNGSDVGSDVTGTKSYHHPIPGLSAPPAIDYADERRRARASGGGYRRGRRDDYGESDEN